MKYEIDFPDLGCWCEKIPQYDEYRFHIAEYTCREMIKVPPNVNGVPVTEVFFQPDHAAYYNLSGSKSILKKVYITKDIRKIEKSGGCYKYMIPEIIIDENNPHFCVYNGVLYRGDRLLFATNVCGDPYEVLSGTREICGGNVLTGLSKVILPSSIRKVDWYALSCCEQIEVFDNVSAEIRYANDESFELTVRSHESGELIYKLYFPKSEYYNYHITENRNMRNLNFAFYDNSFDELDGDVDFGDRFNVCLDRLMYPYRLSKSAEERYKKFISDNGTKAVMNIIDSDNFELFDFLLGLGAVVPENLEELTEYCVRREKVEFTALLLAYKERHFPGEIGSISLE